MGLTVLMMLTYGLACGRPLDLQTGWDCTTRTGARMLWGDLSTEDPYVLVLSFPCSPWTRLSRLNLAQPKSADTVLRTRAENLPILDLSARAIENRLAKGRHVIAEQPRLSEAWEQDVVADRLGKYFASRQLMKVYGDGCAVGYLNPDDGKPFKKPFVIVTTMPAVAAEIDKSSLQPQSRAALQQQLHGQQTH